MPHPNVLQRDLYILGNTILTTRKQPLLASYKLTYRCNLRCAQCPFYSKESRDPSFNEVVGTLDRLYQRGDRLVIFEGGEPMLWRDGERTISDVVNEARERFFCVGMTTNGTLPLTAAVDVLWVSIDGFSKTHNTLRGADIFDTVIKNIQTSSHPKILAHVTINANNYQEVPELIRYLCSIVKGVTVQFYYPYNHKDDLFLDFEKREALLEKLIAIKKSGYAVLNSISALEALKRNHWKCIDWLMDNANPDNSITQGCYLKGREDIDCARCGFSPHTEISLAYLGKLDAINSGMAIFFRDH
jgi:MoaA/NifB/PqqE/SkfB family radical SAM enzyme